MSDLKTLREWLTAPDDVVGPACANVPVPPTIATDEEFRGIYSQGYRHALSDVRQLDAPPVAGSGEPPPLSQKAARREVNGWKERAEQAEAERDAAHRDLDYARAHRKPIADRLGVPLPQSEGKVWQAIERALDEHDALREQVARFKQARALTRADAEARLTDDVLKDALSANAGFACSCHLDRAAVRREVLNALFPEDRWISRADVGNAL